MISACDHSPDNPPNTSPFNRFYLGWIRALVFIISWLMTAAAFALPIFSIPDASPVLVGALAVFYAAIQWFTGRLCQRGWVDRVAHHWANYDRTHPELTKAIALARLPSLYQFPLEYISQLWAQSYPLIGVFLVIAFLSRNVTTIQLSPIVIAVALAVLPPFAQVVRWAVLRLPVTAPETSTLRGRKRTLFQEASARQAQLVAEGVATLFWGGLQIVIDRTLTHFTFVGNNRSGKTVNLRLFLQRLFRHLLGDSLIAARAIVFDPKTNFVPYLVGMGVPLEKICIMHPFDQRGCVWDIAADVKTPTDARSIAGNLVPEIKEGNQEFFQSVARDIVGSEMIALHEACPGRWDLRDLLLVNWSPERVESLLSRTPLTRHVLDQYRGNSRTMGDIVATIRKNLATFESVAACAHHGSKKRKSLTQWLKTNDILVFPYSDTAKEQVNVITRCMFERACNLLLSPEGGPDRGRTWIIIDEAKESGSLPGLSSVMLRGAEHRVNAAIGFQSVQGMWQVYGENVAGEIIGQCNNLAVFRLGNDHRTAQWAADTIGKAERLERHRSDTEGKERSHTVSESTHDRHLYLPEELQNLPATNFDNGLQGVFISEQYGVVDASEADISGAELFEQMLLPPDENTPRFVPHPDAHHFLLDWTPEDLRRLGFTVSNGHATDDPLSRVRRL